MADYQHILLDKDPVQYIARLTITRPQKRNALNDLTVDELGDALEDVDSIRVLVITGTGRAFCAGGDPEQVTMEMARKIASGPPIAMRLSKLMLYQGLEFDLETAMKMAAAETITLTSRDHGEGPQAIRESRNPVYEGR